MQAKNVVSKVRKVAEKSNKKQLFLWRTPTISLHL